MGTVCSPDVDEKKGNTARRRGASVRDTEYAESISESDSDYAESDGGPSHTPQPSRDEIDRERAIQGFINAFKNANHSLVMHLVDDYHELNLMSHIFENGDDCLRLAVRLQSDDLVIFCIEEGVNVNAQNTKTGETALHIAASKNMLRIAAMLLDEGADPLIENEQDETAAGIAHELNDYDMEELLSPPGRETIRSLSDADDDDDVPKMKTAQINDDAADILGADDADDVPVTAAAKSRSPSSAKKTYQVDTAFERALDKDPNARLKMEAQRVQRSNPFTKLKRQNTLQALEAMKVIQSTTDQLPKLESWLEKQRNKKGHRSYQQRWVVVKGSHMLWSDKQRFIKDPKNKAERAKFNNFINIMSMKDIKPVVTKSNNKFSFMTGAGKRKEYVWKAKSTKERDFWISGLKQHQDHVKSMINYLGAH